MFIPLSDCMVSMTTKSSTVVTVLFSFKFFSIDDPLFLQHKKYTAIPTPIRTAQATPTTIPTIIPVLEGEDEAVLDELEESYSIGVSPDERT